MSDHRHFAALLAGAALLASSPAASQETAGATRERVAAFTSAIAFSGGEEDQFARWDREICPRVAGLPATAAQTLIDHLALRAHSVGLNTGAPGCNPNLIVIFSPDGNAVAREIVDTRRDLLGYYDEQNVTTAGREALEAFANNARPIRWWHVLRRVGANGETLNDSDTRRGQSGTESAAAMRAAAQGRNVAAAGLEGGTFEGADAVRTSGSRTRRTTRQDIVFALIVVDAPSAERASTTAVADYIAMTALAPVDQDADVAAFPSVLNLFRSDAAPTAMTAWDSAFLQGLYRTRRDAAARQQRNDIARRMTRQIGAN